MTKPQYTSKDWYINSDNKTEVLWGEGYVVADCNTEESAYLIAAVPEMLTALKLLLDDSRLMNAMSVKQAGAVLNAFTKASGATNA